MISSRREKDEQIKTKMDMVNKNPYLIILGTAITELNSPSLIITYAVVVNMNNASLVNWMLMQGPICY